MTTPTREQEDDLFAEWMDAACLVWGPRPDVIEPAPGTHLSSGDVRQLIRVAWMRAHTAGRDQGLREAKEAFSLSEHMHKRNTGLMVCVSDLSAVIVRMAAGIDHLSETARQWEPDHSSGADRLGLVLATEARDDALRLLKEHAAAIEQLRGK